MGPFSDNDPIVTVQTPDGRTVQLPQSVAQTFGGQLTPVAQPSPTPGPTIAPPSSAPGILPPQAPQPPSPSAPAPSSPPIPGGQMGAPKRSDGLPSFTAAEADRLDPTNPINKPPQEITTDQLRKQGEAGVYNAQAKGFNDVAAAGRSVANAEAAQQLTLAGAYHEQNAKIDGLLQKRADDIADQQKQIADRVGQYDQAVKQYADFKVDRSIQHPIVAALGLVLGAIGAAWANKSENPAMTALMAQIDKNVQDQLHQRDALGNVINQKKTGIDIIRAQAQDRTAQYNLAIAGEIERTKRVGDELTARSNSDIVKANWGKTRAELEVKQADALGGAVDKQHAADQQAAQLAEQKRAAMASEGVAYGHLKLAKDQAAFDNNFKTQEQAIKVAEFLASQKGIDPSKVGELGVGGMPTVKTDKDGAPVANADGSMKVDYKPLVNSDGTPFMAPTKEEAIALRKQKAGVDRVSQFVNDMTEGIARHGGESAFLASGDFQEMMSHKEALLMALHQAYGIEGMRPGVLEQMEKALGGVDPTSFFRNATPGLQAALRDVVSGYDYNMRAAGYTGDKYEPFKRTGKTAAVAPGDMAFQDLLRNPLDKDSSRTARELRVEPQKGETSSMYIARLKSAYADTGGILPSQKQVLDTYAQVIADPKARPEQKKIASESLSKAAADAQTEGVRSYADQLQTKLAAPQTPAEERPPVGYGARDTSYGGPQQTLSAVMAQKPLADLVEGAQLGDVTSKQEINRRIAAGDKQAQKALAAVIRSIK